MLFVVVVVSSAFLFLLELLTKVSIGVCCCCCCCCIWDANEDVGESNTISCVYFLGCLTLNDLRLFKSIVFSSILLIDWSSFEAINTSDSFNLISFDNEVFDYNISLFTSNYKYISNKFMI